MMWFSRETFALMKAEIFIIYPFVTFILFGVTLFILQLEISALLNGNIVVL